MVTQPRNMPEQEHSIKVRSHELYFEDPPVQTGKATRPFREYLRATPAKPIPTWLQAVFAVVGAIVGVLFFVALWRVAHQQPKAPRPADRSTTMIDATAGLDRLTVASRTS